MASSDISLPLNTQKGKKCYMRPPKVRRSEMLKRSIGRMSPTSRCYRIRQRENVTCTKLHDPNHSNGLTSRRVRLSRCPARQRDILQPRPSYAAQNTVKWTSDTTSSMSCCQPRTSKRKMFAYTFELRDRNCLERSCGMMCPMSSNRTHQRETCCVHTELRCTSSRDIRISPYTPHQKCCTRAQVA
jgi:hypothetical protein